MEEEGVSRRIGPQAERVIDRRLPYVKPVDEINGTRE
jgi:hypothetical protein